VNSLSLIFTWILSPLWTHLASIVGCVLGATAVAHSARQNRAPTATIAWLLAIVLVPYLGVPGYLLFGGRKARAAIASKTKIALPTPGGATGEMAQIERLLLGDGVPPASSDNCITLQITGEAIYGALVDLIEHAQHSIDVCTFVLHADEVGRDILARLTRRAGEGLRIRVLIDGLGSVSTSKRVFASLVAAGGQFAIFTPVLHLPFRGRSNLRNHRKLIVADGQRVFAGGANVASEYMGPVPKPGRWRDVSFTLEGSAVASYVHIFASDWAYATGTKIPPSAAPLTPITARASLAPRGTAKAQVVPSGPDVTDDPLYDALLTLAFAARERLWVVTPYFVPDESLSRALDLAAHRGVDVRILVPDRSNHFLADVAGRSYLRDLRNRGGKILRYPGMVHAKGMLVDREVALLGSANYDMRSLLLNYEVGLFLYSAAELEAVERWMRGLMDLSKEGVPDTGRFGEIGEGLARLVAPQL
jgi:cardiolipin synthase A/B